MKLSKRILIALAALLIITTAQAQDLGSIMKSHANSDEIKYVKINKAMLRIAGFAADKETRQILKKISGMQVLMADKEVDFQPLLTDINQAIERDQFEKLVEATEEGHHVKVYYKEKNKKESEMLMVMQDKTGALQLMLIDGSLTMEEMMKLNMEED